MEECDILVVGASFAGLTFGHHCKSSYKVVMLDRKTRLDSAIETTGLITQATKDLLSAFCRVDDYIPNRITTIGVVSPNYNKYFFSHTNDPWIYSTDTPQLVKHLSETLPKHVELRLGAGVVEYIVEPNNPYPVVVNYIHEQQKKTIRAKFIIGADGSHSLVAKKDSRLSKNTKFLAGYEKVFYGDITFGDHPENTVYHFWFGEFSLGYGGWLSPTIINGRKAFRLGLAKLEKDTKNLNKIDEFIEVLKKNNIISIAKEEQQAIVSFAHLIPIGGALKKISTPHSLLIGDAAGFCGAFAADGIKGAVISGQVAARLVDNRLQGDTKALDCFKKEIQKNNKLMTYYKKQVLYRFLWDRMKSNRSFHILFDLIAREKEGFLHQFCDSKDKRKSLMRVVLKVKNIPQLVWYALSLAVDLFR